MPTDSQQSLGIGDSVPYFNLPGTDGMLYSPADFHGHQAMVVVFTCNHCPYAQAKLEALNDIATDFDDVAVVGINPNSALEQPEDSYDRMKDLVADGTVRYDAYLRDEPQDTARSFGATCTPDPFLFRFDERQGAFRLAYHGRVDDAMSPDESPSQHDIREAIEAVLASEQVDAGFRPSRGCSIRWKTSGEFSRAG